MTNSDTRTKDQSTKKLPQSLRTAIDAALDKKAAHIVVLDLRKADGFTDFFLICSGASTRQVQTIAEAIEQELRQLNVRASHLEGARIAEWILMDYFDFVVHVFTPRTRLFYGLERLWGSADRIDVPTPDRVESERSERRR